MGGVRLLDEERCCEGGFRGLRWDWSWLHGCGLLECRFGIDYVYSLHCMEDDLMAFYRRLGFDDRASLSMS